MEKITAALGRDLVILVFVAIALALGLSFLISYPLMLIWNGCLVGAIAGVAEVGWLQMWGISFLISMLFKTNVTTK